MSLRASRGRGVGGLSAVAALLAAIPYEVTGHSVFFQMASVFLLLAIITFIPAIGWSRRLYVIVGVALAVLVLTTREDAIRILAVGLERSLFTATFFIALLSISSVAGGSATLLESGLFIAKQPAGRRYLALTIGGHLFGLIMHYGSISLLGALVTQSNKGEPPARANDTRRMLLAIQRGFISTLPWTPLSFPIVITITLVPGANWAEAVFFCVCSSLILCGAGWALDSLSKGDKDNPTAAIAHRKINWPDWATYLLPLFQLLGAVFIVVSAMSYAAGLRIPASVMISAPVISVIWYLIQSRSTRASENLPPLGRRLTMFSMREVPQSGGELTLLIMAPFIGAIGAEMLKTVMVGYNMHIDRLSPSALLLLVFWLMPIMGQLGMHPLLSVSILAALIPDPARMGVDPAALVTAITSGWALSGATSPFTASVLLVAKLGNAKPFQVGLGWNGLFTLIAGTSISILLLVLARLT